MILRNWSVKWLCRLPLSWYFNALGIKPGIFTNNQVNIKKSNNTLFPYVAKPLASMVLNVYSQNKGDFSLEYNLGKSVVYETESIQKNEKH